MKRVCSIPGCNKPAIARGWCEAHYMRFRRYGDPLVLRNDGKRRGHPLYHTWWTMLRRCDDASNRNYGGRGIGVYPAWRDFWTFVAAIGPRPTPKHTIDRWPDLSGNYEPGNVRWATKSQQARNMRTNRYITANGQTQLLVDWARDLEVGRDAIYRRIRRGCSEEEAIRTPAKN